MGNREDLAHRHADGAPIERIAGCGVHQHGLDTEAGRQEALEMVGGEGTLLKVDQRKGDDLYGAVTSHPDGGFLVATEGGEVRVESDNVKKFQNLETLSGRAGRKRASSFLLYSGVAAASFYSASTEDNELEEQSQDSPLNRKKF